MLAQALVWPMVIEMADVLIKNSVGMSRMVNQHLVGAFSADAANEPLRVTTEEVDTARGVLYDEQDVQPVKQQGVDAKKSVARMPWAWVVRNCRQVGPLRRGAGSMPARLRISHMVLGADW